MIETYRARRRMEMAPGLWREPEQLLPEAVTWVRKDAYVHGGFITEATVSEHDFAAAVQEFCPEQAERIFELSGADPNVRLDGVHKTPFRERPTDPSELPKLIAIKPTAKASAHAKTAVTAPPAKPATKAPAKTPASTAKGATKGK